VERAYRLLRGQGLVSYRGERHTVPAQGAAGGSPGRTGAAWIERADGRRTELPAKARATWAAGDLLVIRTAGAGGWGEPDTSATAADAASAAGADTDTTAGAGADGACTTDRSTA
jgi:N-methylhydantoinase B/oxoprolinase/acetone carboxylase alpha subunit